MILSISGIDGSGKTSIIDKVIHEFNADGRPTRYVWLRYNHYLTKILLVFCRLVGLTRYEYSDGVRVGYHDFHRSQLVSWIFIILTYIDTFLVSVFLVYLPSYFTSRALVCDRWILDIMIDLEIDTRISFSNGSWLERTFRGLMPEGAQCFLIIREQKSVLQCRPENERDRDFPDRWSLYQDYSHRPWVIVVENITTIEDAVAKIMQRVVSDGDGR